MKILQLCHKPPIPAKDGGCIAMNNLTRGLLKQGHVVKILAMSTPKHSFSEKDISAEYCEQTAYETIAVDTKINYFLASKSIILNQSYYVNRFFSKNFSNKLIRVLQSQSFDLIQLESIFVAPYISVIKQYSTAKIILRAHNIEHKIWERLAKQQSSLLKKLAFSILAKKLKRFELSVFSQIHGYMTISEQDYDYFHEQFPNISGTVIAFGIDPIDYEEEDYIPSENPELFHLGSLDWKPNLEGIDWFLNEVWEEMHVKFPQLTFTVAGRHIPSKLKALQLPNVIILGEVADAQEFMHSKDIMIVPILSGSGVRVKIIEGMALGKTIITTSIGAEGLEIENGKHLFIADDKEDFIHAVEKCIKTPDICKIIGENARNFVVLYHNNDLIINKMVGFYADILKEEYK